MTVAFGKISRYRLSFVQRLMDAIRFNAKPDNEAKPLAQLPPPVVEHQPALVPAFSSRPAWQKKRGKPSARPLCRKCDKPLSKATRPHQFSDPMPLSVVEVHRRIPEGMVVTRMHWTQRGRYDAERNFHREGPTYCWSVNLWDGVSYGNGGYCGTCLPSDKVVYDPWRAGDVLTGEELVQTWQALAFHRTSRLDTLEKNPDNARLREEVDRLRSAMLKIRFLAERKGKSVEFEYPAIVQFGGESWHDLEDA